MNMHDPRDHAAPPREYDRLPFSLETEQELLGAVLLQNDTWFPCSDQVEAEHFFEPFHQRLWSIMSDRIGSGQTISIVTVGALLGADADADMAGMTVKQYLARVATSATIARMAPNHAKVVRELWARRKIILMARDLQAQALGHEGVDVDAVLEQADAELGAIRFGKTVAGIYTLSDLAQKAMQQTAEAFEKDAAVGFSTGVASIDEVTGPLMAGDFVTVLAPSGHGKSAFGAQILHINCQPSLDAHRDSAPGVFFSMEMEGIAVARRQIAYESGVSTRAQKEASLNEAQYGAMDDAVRGMARLPFLIDQSGRQKASNIVKKLRALKRTHGIKLAVVDHLKLIVPENPRWTKFDTIDNAALTFKDAAKELGICIVALAQVTRESQKDKTTWRIGPQDLWGGETVKECSDLLLTVTLPYRFLLDNEVGKDNPKRGDWEAKCLEWNGTAEIAAPKVRDGEPAGWRRVGWNGASLKFFDK